MFIYLSLIVSVLIGLSSLIDGASVLTSLNGNYQITPTEASPFSPYLYPRVANLTSTREFSLLIPPIPINPANPAPRFNLQLGAANGIIIITGYIINAVTLRISTGGGNYQETLYDADNFDSTIDEFRVNNPNANARDQTIGWVIGDFRSKTDIFAQVFDTTAGTRTTYWIHATVAPLETNVELVVSMDFGFKCEDGNYNGTNFIEPLTTELNKNLGSLSSVTTIRVQSADCSSDSPQARFSIRSSGSIDSKQSGYDAYLQLLKNIQNTPTTSSDVRYLSLANTVSVASVNVLPVPPPQPSSANKTLAVVVGVCGAIAALIMVAIFIYFHKKKQAGQWNNDKENSTWTNANEIQTVA